ncbi:MAG: flavoprotein [Planctomycetota bacterium]|jgi:phosphopantothenoylcysteine decarboxylase/phosphopantothenate--cysteine ligase
MLDNLNILLGVTGGVAAYKAVDLASKLTARGAAISTVMSESACRLVGPKSFEAVTRSPVHTTMWDTPAEYEIGRSAPSFAPVGPGSRPAQHCLPLR